MNCIATIIGMSKSTATLHVEDQASGLYVGILEVFVMPGMYGEMTSAIADGNKREIEFQMTPIGDSGKRVTIATAIRTTFTKNDAVNAAKRIIQGF